MNIPQINENVTGVEREKTKRACELLGYKTDSSSAQMDADIYARRKPREKYHSISLRHGSLTIDQTVGILKELGYEWLEASDDINGPTICQGWHSGEKSFSVDDPHSLSENLDVLIKVLEEKEKETK